VVFHQVGLLLGMSSQVPILLGFCGSELSLFLVRSGSRRLVLLLCDRNFFANLLQLFFIRFGFSGGVLFRNFGRVECFFGLVAFVQSLLVAAILAGGVFLRPRCVRSKPPHGP